MADNEIGNGFRMFNNGWLDGKKVNSSWFLSMLGTKAMSQIETTSCNRLIQPLLSYHTRQQTKSPRNQIKRIPSPLFRKSENGSKPSASKAYSLTVRIFQQMWSESMDQYEWLQFESELNYDLQVVCKTQEKQCNDR